MQPQFGPEDGSQATGIQEGKRKGRREGERRERRNITGCVQYIADTVDSIAVQAKKEEVSTERSRRQENSRCTVVSYPTSKMNISKGGYAEVNTYIDH